MVSCTVVRVAPTGRDPIGQAMAMVETVDPNLASILHDGNGVRPYALASSADWREYFVFRADVARAMAVGAGRLGALLSVRDEPLTAERAAPRVVLETESPVLFRGGRVSGSPNASERRASLFPSPERILDDLARKWTELTKDEREPIHGNRIGGQIERYRLGQWSAGRHRWQGWTGALSLDLSPLSPDEQAAVWQLLRFGELRGLGAKTTYGMGRIRVAPG